MNKELTKEEILRKHFDVIWTHQQFDSFSTLVFAAMDWFADQQSKKEAIAFLLDTTGDMFKDNAEQLYQLYSSQK